MLEEILLTFEGTVLLVSHDRDFMDNVVTGLLILEGDGVVDEQAGGYSDWEARGGRLVEESENRRHSTPTADPAPPRRQTRPAKKRKLSYKDQRELDSLPGLIETLENRQQALELQVSDADFYQQEHAQVQQVLDELQQVQSQLESTFERWTELEGEED